MYSELFEPAPRRRMTAPSLTDLCVALVDDPLGLAVLERVLDAAGARVLTAASYAEALASPAIRACDVLIASLELPYASTDELTRMVASLTSPRACIALTRRGDGAGLDAAWRAGFRMCVRTPCEPELVANAAAIVGGFTLRR